LWIRVTLGNGSATDPVHCETGGPCRFSRRSAPHREVEHWQHPHVAFGSVAKRKSLPFVYGNVGLSRSENLMVALNDITRDAVLAAIAEYDHLGREAFLEKYGFGQARQYVLVHNGKRYDSKAIVGVAYGLLTGNTPLTASDFSGGEATVGRLLRRRGFTVEVGEALTADRLVRILSRLPVDRRDGLPALHQPITLLWAFGRAFNDEPRLASWSETRQQVSDLFDRYGRPWESDRVYYPIAALHGAGLWELDGAPEMVPSAHGSSIPQHWFDQYKPRGGLAKPVHNLVRDWPETRAAAVRALVETYFLDADSTELLAELGLLATTGGSPVEASSAALFAAYRHLCSRADIFWRNRDTQRAERTSFDPVRSDASRRAVLLRSGGRCENPRCTGDVQDRTLRGEPILEIDHVDDLALGGADHPAQMIALCPNCHAVKTRGRTREELRSVLLEAAKEKHEQWSASSGSLFALRSQL
jgi:5-methylcytosine-specific restriction protein A